MTKTTTEIAIDVSHDYEIVRWNGEWFDRGLAWADTEDAARLALKTLADDEALGIGHRDGFALRAKYGIHMPGMGVWVVRPLGL